MEKFRKYNITLIMFFISLMGIGQIGVGEWRDHLPYRRAFGIIEQEGKIYCATRSGIIIYNKKDNSIEKLSKIQGLSDLNITAIGYSVSNSTIVIGYKNGNIDLIVKNEIININDIKRKTLFGSKAINNIFIEGDYAYLSCGFGVVILDLKNEEIKETYQIQFENSNLAINDITIVANWIYLATQSGVYKGNVQSNLLDFRNWEKIADIPLYEYNISNIEYFEGNIYISASNIEDDEYLIYYFNDISWNKLNNVPKEYIYSIDAVNNSLYISFSSQICIYGEKGNLIDKITNEDINWFNPAKVFFDSEGIIWIADRSSGLITENFSNGYNIYHPNGPNSNEIWKIDIVDGNLYAVNGGYSESWQNLWRTARLYNFKNETWRSYTYWGIGEAVSLAINPNNTDNVFVGSFNFGVLEFDKGEIINQYNVDNSNKHTLQSIIPGSNYIRITGMVYDNQRNLWMTNAMVPNLVSVLNNDASWTGIPLGNKLGLYYASEIINTKNNYKWIVLALGGGIMVFDDNGTIDNTDDDQYKRFGIFDHTGTVITNSVMSIAEDNEGDIWVGTKEGVYVFYNPENVFSGTNFYASDILIPINDSIAAKLLETETVTCIEIDGANRKWFGTKGGGAFLFSEDGLNQIANFNTSNSPILSNHIIDIEIDGRTGEVFFATGEGLISYKGTASDEDLQKDLTYVYPNPVRENYKGPITITGLFAESNVKITDISGNIVYEAETMGGQVVWDGNNFDGQRVKSGVYLIFCTNKDGTKTKMAKLVIVN